MGDQIAITERRPAYIRFKNNTHYNIEVIWINFHNKENSYGILAPSTFLDVNTYSTHSWIFRECISKNLMVVAGKEVFMARSWFEEHRRLEFKHPINIPLRTMVLIDIPALDLRLLCLLKLTNLLKTKDDVSLLELPLVLQRELVQMIANKETSNI